MNQTQVEQEVIDHSDDQFLVCLDETDMDSGQAQENETKPIGVVFVWYYMTGTTNSMPSKRRSNRRGMTSMSSICALYSACRF